LSKSDRHLQLGTEGKLHKQAILLCLSDLFKAFEYVEAHSDNLNVFSHRFYELLLRGCTEFESLAKTILAAKAIPTSKKTDISDYFKLTEHFPLKECFMWVGRWNPGPVEAFPFKDWNDPKIGPNWYSDYNSVKHSRLSKFHLANLHNALDSIAANVVLMSVAYGDNVFGSPSWGRATSDGKRRVSFYDDISIGFGEPIIESSRG
jgi:hypothetical protein